MRFTRARAARATRPGRPAPSSCRRCTVFIAAGTAPNTVLAREDAQHFLLDGKYFRACDEDGDAGEARATRCRSPSAPTC